MVTVLNCQRICKLQIYKEKITIISLDHYISNYARNKHQRLVAFFLAILLQHYKLWPLIVNAQQKSIGIWKTDNWKSCLGDCGYNGFQLRRVTCSATTLPITFPKVNCNQADKPSDRKNCFKVCNQHKNEFQWRTSQWSECRNKLSCEDGGFSCGNDEMLPGIQTRSVECVSLSNMTNIVNDYICLTFFPRPATRKNCLLLSPVDCVASMFGEWTECTRSCGHGSQIKTRRVLRNARFGGKRCDDMLQVRPCPYLPPCTTNPADHRMKFEKWSKCKIATVNVHPFLEDVKGKTNRRRRARIVAGLVGTRTRRASCLDYTGKQLGGSVILVETCPLVVTCAVSHWSEWGGCGAACGETGKQIRSRDVVRLPQGDEPEPCPVTTESRQCNAPLDAIAPCFRYSWVTGTWGRCRPFNNATCGGGEQPRQVYCVLDNEVTNEQVPSSKSVVMPTVSGSVVSKQPVDESKCNQSLKPVEWQNCDLPCAQKCDLGPWSAWSNCVPTHCPGDSASAKLTKNRRRKRSGFKRRVREIYNVFGSNDSCSHTLEVAPCNKARCFAWYISTSAPCQVQGGTCGAGTVTHHQVCQDMWERLVSDDKCQNSAKFPAVTPCHVACPSDCVVSEWGSWTSCPNTCRSKKKKLKQQTRSRFIVARPGSLGLPCPGPDNLTQSRSCNPHSCSIYYWKAFSWENCRFPSNETARDGRSYVGSQEKPSNWTPSFKESVHSKLQNSRMQSCPEGFQTRRVICEKKRSGKVSRKNCIDWDKPVSSRSCVIECSMDCVLSMWSEWTSCDEECARVRATRHHGLSAAFQQRHRYVIHKSMGAGSCSNDLDQIRPCLHCATFEWRVSKWSPCLLAVGMVTALEGGGKCLGVKTRIVACYRISLNESKEAVKHGYCLTSVQRIPLATRPCFINCPRDFSFNEWKERLNCQAEANPIVLFSQPDLASKSTPYPNNPIVKPIGPWSTCFTDPTILSQFADECVVSKLNDVSRVHNAPSCGVGKRRRAVGCFEGGTGIMFRISFCNYRDYDEEDCQVPCPVDCHMGEWSSWGNCQAVRNDQSQPSFLPCGEGLRVRFKHVVDAPAHGGRPCPAVDDLAQMYESELCYNECGQHFQVAINGTVCDTQRSGDACGPDHQTQEAVCYLTQAGGDVRSCEINETFEARQCDGSCVGACVLSGWGAWHGCVRCNGEPRTRRRRVLRQPNPDASCSAYLKETETCLLNVNCFTYSWGWTEWSSCTLPGGAECGLGVQKRKGNCIKSNGVPVSIARCAAHNATLSTLQSHQCRVDCPLDCKLSDWSVWSSCSASCGLSRIRTRMRKVIRNAVELGRPCSHELTQHLPCCAKPCYSWKFVGWGECQLPGYNCGEGAQQMEVACVEQDGTRVNETLCKLEQRRQERGSGSFYEWFPLGSLSRPCIVPCPGERRLTEWSVWGECHGGCNSSTIYGTKSRSRIAYNGKVVNENFCGYDVDEAQCDNPTCFSYKWKMSDFIEGTRSVWCERVDDGIIVKSGCNESNKPTEEMLKSECHQNCDEIKHGYCSGATGDCDCIPPFLSNYNSNGELECTDPNVGYPATYPLIINWKSTWPPPTQIVINSEEVTRGMEFTSSPSEETTPADSSWPALNPLNPDGTLKAWAFGAMAGLVVLLCFVVVMSYFIIAACRRREGKPRRRSGGSGSNMGIGIVVASSGGSYAYGPGGNGLPPYYMSSASPPRYKLDHTPAPRASSSASSSYYDEEEENR